MARNDKKKQHTFEKKVKEKKETILIEVLKSEKDMYSLENENIDKMVTSYKGFPFIKLVKRFGKLYALCINEKL